MNYGSCSTNSTSSESVQPKGNALLKEQVELCIFKYTNGSKTLQEILIKHYERTKIKALVLGRNGLLNDTPRTCLLSIRTRVLMRDIQDLKSMTDEGKFPTYE